MILAGDIGGTKTNLALFSDSSGELKLEINRTYKSSDFSDFYSLLDQFISETQPKLNKACFGIAGPIINGRCDVTYLPWVIDQKELQEKIGISSVTLINDLAAMAGAIPFLPSTKLETIHTGKEISKGRVGILAAGTGLGQAFLIPDQRGRFLILETEGGQCDFPARSMVEIELMGFVKQLFGRVKIEHILSGSGLVRIYNYFREKSGEKEPAWLKDEFQKMGAAEAICELGLLKKVAHCLKALELFSQIYGAISGNLALQLVTRKGIYIGGGIAPKILPLLKSNLFLEAFLDKGEFQDFMKEIPVKVIMDVQAPLWGAAYFALGEKVYQW